MSLQACREHALLRGALRIDHHRARLQVMPAAQRKFGEVVCRTGTGLVERGAVPREVAVASSFVRRSWKRLPMTFSRGGNLAARRRPPLGRCNVVPRCLLIYGRRDQQIHRMNLMTLRVSIAIACSREGWAIGEGLAWYYKWLTIFILAVFAVALVSGIVIGAGRAVSVLAADQAASDRRSDFLDRGVVHQKSLPGDFYSARRCAGPA